VLCVVWAGDGPIIFAFDACAGWTDALLRERGLVGSTEMGRRLVVVEGEQAGQVGHRTVLPYSNDACFGNVVVVEN
jgi:hypothetical protein